MQINDNNSPESAGFPFFFLMQQLAATGFVAAYTQDQSDQYD